MVDRKKAWTKYLTAVILFIVVQTIIASFLVPLEVLIGFTLAEIIMFIVCIVIKGVFNTETELFRDQLEQHRYLASSTGVSTDGSRTLTCPFCNGTGYYQPCDVDELEQIRCRYCSRQFDFRSDTSDA